LPDEVRVTTRGSRGERSPSRSPPRKARSTRVPALFPLAGQDELVDPGVAGVFAKMTSRTRRSSSTRHAPCPDHRGRRERVFEDILSWRRGGSEMNTSGHRSGDHRQPRVVYDGAEGRSPAYKEFPQQFPKPGCGRARPRGHLAERHGPGPEASWPRSQGRPSPPSASPIKGDDPALDRETGRPVHNAIVWQCRRTESLCRVSGQARSRALVRRRTGLPIDAYSPPEGRLAPEGRRLTRRAEPGVSVFGTPDSWLLWKLTGGRGTPRTRRTPRGPCFST